MRSNMVDEKNSFDHLKYLLGNMGIDILLAVEKGARNFETIEIISGVPIACIKGRLPVLIDFNLAKEDSSGYIITQYGTNFIKSLEKRS